MNRRTFNRTLVYAALAGVAGRNALAEVRSEPSPSSPVPSNQKPLTVAMLMYPELTALDLIGPQTVLSNHAKIHLVWKSHDVIFSDRGIGLTPNSTFEECPRDLDVLFVPGGPGMLSVMRDRKVLDFLADRGERARYVTSVCTGALILGMAGLLEGYKATSHWLSLDVLPRFGALPVKQRVVVDRNRMTGGGVTAGLDFGFALLAALRGETAAKVTQLAMEYDPKPPFDAGSPETAGPEITALAKATLGPLQQQTRAAIEEILATRK